MFKICKYRNTRYFAIYTKADELICVCVYKRGAQAVLKLLTEAMSSK